MNQEHRDSIRGEVMKAIAAGRVQMRPRWHFILLSALTILGAFIVLLTLLYVASLALFFLRDSGVYFAPTLGPRGWWALPHSLPWTLILLVILFVLVLELLVRHYAFVYRKPLLTSVLAIVLTVLLGGFAIAQTPFHRELSERARRGGLPLPVGLWYGGMFRAAPPREIYRGAIVEPTKNGFVMLDENGAGTTTVTISSRTRLPYGEEFSPGDMVVVIGDRVATGSIEAYGVREIQD